MKYIKEFFNKEQNFFKYIFCFSLAFASFQFINYILNLYKFIDIDRIFIFLFMLLYIKFFDKGIEYFLKDIKKK